MHQTLCCLVYGRVVRLVISPFIPDPIHGDNENRHTVSGLKHEPMEKENVPRTLLLNGDAISNKKAL